VEQVYDGSVFDAGGAELNVGNWGGFWEETQRKAVIDQFEADFNARVNYDSAAPFYPKMAVSGVDNPVLDVYSFDQDSQYDNAPFIVSHDAILANVPNAANLWPFWTASTGGMWSFSEIGYAYRTDLVPEPPTGFGAIFDPIFDGKRGHYIPENGVGIRTLLVSALANGSGPTDEEAAFGPLEAAAPWKVVDFTGTMQGLLEQGEVWIATQHDAEVWDMQQRGLPIGWIPWDDVTRPLLPQQFGVARGSANLPLAYAFLNRMFSPEVQSVWAQDMYMRPTNMEVELPEVLTSRGVANTADGTAGLDGLQESWQWWFENAERLIERYNRTFSL
jgi:putative spermidine/putrescine transport system substrate-binding protein